MSSQRAGYIGLSLEAVDLSQIRTDVLDIDPYQLGQLLYPYVVIGSTKERVSKDDLTVYRKTGEDVPDDISLGWLLEQGNRFFDSLFYMALGEGEKWVPEENEHVGGDGPTTGIMVAEALFFQYFMILQRGKPSDDEKTTRGSVVPKFLSETMGLDNSPGYYSDILASFPLVKLDPRWVMAVPFEELGQQAKSRFGLALAGDRPLNPFRYLEPLDGLRLEVIASYNFAMTIISHPSNWDFHPATRNADLLKTYGTFNDNLANLSMECFSKKQLKELVDSKAIFALPEYKPNAQNYKSWAGVLSMDLNRNIFNPGKGRTGTSKRYGGKAGTGYAPGSMMDDRFKSTSRAAERRGPPGGRGGGGSGPTGGGGGGDQGPDMGGGGQGGGDPSGRDDEDEEVDDDAGKQTVPKASQMAIKVPSAARIRAPAVPRGSFLRSTAGGRSSAGGLKKLTLVPPKPERTLEEEMEEKDAEDAKILSMIEGHSLDSKFHEDTYNREMEVARKISLGGKGLGSKFKEVDTKKGEGPSAVSKLEPLSQSVPDDSMLEGLFPDAEEEEESGEQKPPTPKSILKKGKGKEVVKGGGKISRQEEEEEKRKFIKYWTHGDLTKKYEEAVITYKDYPDILNLVKESIAERLGEEI